jgi:hypothetical protein
MSAADRIFLKLKRTYHQSRFARAVVGILDTPFVSVGPMPFTLVSMVQSRDVLPYLVAVKSFVRFANPRRIVVVCDPSITTEDRAVFSHHIPHVELRDAREFTHEHIPLGGTWERLFAISDYCKQDYVVQLDADTITMLPPAEVIHSVTAHTAFVMSGESSSGLMSLEETAAQAPSCEPGESSLQHIQDLVERNIASSNLPTKARYVRGCSGFTGFPKSTTMTKELLAFSKAMRAVHGKRWAEWGTEQITSNYLVANANEATVLPFLTYGTPDVLHQNSILTHFIGSMRFTSNKYRAATLKTIQQLISAPSTGQELELELALTLALAPKETEVFLGSVQIR